MPGSKTPGHTPPLDLHTDWSVSYIMSTSSVPPTRAERADATRDRILRAAFLEFYHHGFQGGSLNRVVAAAGTTKGALFHHFAGKRELGYAVVEEVIGPLLESRWLDPITEAAAPPRAMSEAFRTHVQADLDSGHWIWGCPLNNLAQEMAPLDAGFRERINDLYGRWRSRYAAALERGIAAGRVRSGVEPEAVAALVVASQMGIWGTGKSGQDRSAMLAAMGAVCAYLKSLEA
jgi:TetR/AcrR family transcriptional regulator, transcriptional repressor for nem operon